MKILRKIRAALAVFAALTLACFASAADIKVTWTIDPAQDPVIQSGTAQGGAASSITLAASSVSAGNYCVAMKLRLTGGTGAGQEKVITAYNGGTKVATVDSAWATVPDATTTYQVHGINQISVGWYVWRPSEFGAMMSAGSVVYGTQSNNFKNPPGLPTEVHWSDTVHYRLDPATRQRIPFTLQPGDVAQPHVRYGTFSFTFPAPNSTETTSRSVWIDPGDGSTEPQPVYQAFRQPNASAPGSTLPPPLNVTAELIP